MSIGKNSLARAASLAATPKEPSAAPVAEPTAEAVTRVAVGDIRPGKGKDLPAPALCRSVEKHGVIEPLLLARVGEHDLRVIAGEARLAAAVAAGMDTVPAVVRPMTAAEAAALRKELKNSTPAPLHSPAAPVVPQTASITEVGEDMPEWLL